RKQQQSRLSLLCLVSCGLHGDGQCAGFPDGLRHSRKIGLAGTNGVLYEATLSTTALLHDVNQWHGWLALAQVITHVLAQRVGVTAVIQDIIHQLEGGTDMAPVSGCRLL